MYVFFDTTDKITRISWQDRGGHRYHQRLELGKSTETLLPALAELLENGEDVLEGLGLVSGPGSFTGIRVGLATVLGLLAAGAFPAYGITRFQLAARQVGDGLLVLPSGREWATQVVHEGQAQGEPAILVSAELELRQDLVTVEPIAGLKSRLIEVDWMEAGLEIITTSPNPEAYPLSPCYARAADAIAGESLIERLLNG